MAICQYNTGRGHVQRQTQNRCQQQKIGEGRKVQWPMRMHRNHQDQKRQQDVKHKECIEQKGGQRQDHHRNQSKNADRHGRALQHAPQLLQTVCNPCQFHDTPRPSKFKHLHFLSRQQRFLPYFSKTSHRQQRR